MCPLRSRVDDVDATLLHLAGEPIEVDEVHDSPEEEAAILGVKGPGERIWLVLNANEMVDRGEDEA